MATINIGSLTFTHKGDYASGTAYVKNDVVYYSTNGNAYIAKTSTTGNAPTSTAHWDLFAAGSGGIWNAGLSLGTAGQVVKVNSGASALEFGTLSSDFVKITGGSHSGTSLILDNIFEDGTTYKTFKIFLTYGKVDNDMYMRGRTGGASGSTVASNDYRYRSKMEGWNSNNTAHDTGEAGWDHSYFRIGYTATQQQNGDNYELTIPNPNNTTHKFHYHFDNVYTTDARVSGAFGAGYINVGTGTAFTGVVFSASSNNTFTANYEVYGIK
jgi:hypothetical protein